MPEPQDVTRACAAESREWRSHPLLSRSLRLLIFGLPVAFSFGAALLLSRWLPRANGFWTAALWLCIVAIGSLLTLVLFERGARRLLPLAALLNVSLLFPDQAPKRFAVARRAGAPGMLRERLEAARAAGNVSQAAELATVIELVLALSVHDKASRGHSERVRVFTDLLTEELKLPEADRTRLRWAALLHDIGKLEVPATLLMKPAKPTEEEWAVLRRHPEEGARLVGPLLSWLGPWGDAVAQHHERYDGTGYPHGLKGTEISLAARIVSVADVYEVMTAPRPYKRAMGIAAARRELIRVAGTQLDPVIVRAFLNISVGRLWRTIGLGAWIGQVPTLGRLLSELGTWAGTGAATAGAAGVIVVGGMLGPPIVGHGGAVLGTPSPPGVIFGGPGGATASPGGASGSGSPGPSATIAPVTLGSGQPTASVPPSGQPTPIPTSRPSPTATARPTPTATPVPTPNPSLCPTCVDPDPNCLTHCTNSTLLLCRSYCLGNDNRVCGSHCYGNDNPACTTWCVGPNNPLCQQHCSSSVALAAMRIRAPAKPVLTSQLHFGMGAISADERAVL